MRRATRIFVSLVALSNPACKGCSKQTGQVAELIARTKVVEKNLAEPESDWRPAKVGTSFVMNEAIRTGPNSTARVSLTGGGGLRLSPDTVIRFGRDASGLAVETGEAELEADVGGFMLDMHVGKAILEGKSRVRIRAADGKVRFDVLVGGVTFEEKDGNTSRVGAGEGFDLDIGAAVFERDVKATPDGDRAPDAGLAERVLIDATVRGRGVQTQAGDADWQDLAAGRAKLVKGVRVRVPKGASVTIARGDERATVAGSGEFVVGKKDGPLLFAQSGMTAVDGQRRDVTINVPGGSVVVRKRSIAEIDVDKKQAASVYAREGSVDVQGTKTTEKLAKGDSALLGKGGEVEITTGEGKLSPPPSREADFAAGVGESLTIHDPKPPTVLSFRIASKCQEDGIIELVRRGASFRRAKTRVKGKGNIAVEIAKGRYSYRLQCGRKTAASGSVTVLRDSGTVPIPKRPPRSTLDTDGRRYTVLYQNLLPIVTLRWRKAPSGPLDLIVVDEKSKQDSYRAKGGAHTFESGEIKEGDYTYYFRSSTSRKASPKTSVSIRFDNAAPTAYVRSPKGNAAWSDTIKVSGVTLKDWTVSVEGKALDIDSQRRFSLELVRPKSALSIRFSHPRRGVHYYVRRSGASGP